LISKTIKVYKVIYPFALTVSLTYAIQYTFFPGVILTHKVGFISDFSWFANTMITLQNIYDTMGRFTAGFLSVKKRMYIILCISR
jgi:hypothetical protein